VEVSKNATKIRLCIGILYYFAALLIPNVFLFELYNRNHLRNHIPFIPTVVVAIVLAITSIVVLSLAVWIVKNMESALIVTIVFWIVFWLFESIYPIALSYSSTLDRFFLLGTSMVALIALCLFLRKHKPPFAKIQNVFVILSVCFNGMFFLNFLPGLTHEIRLTAARNQDDESFFIKQDFIINTELPTPNIYWFHMDGMMSLSIFEEFFGTTQKDLRNELGIRGFIINENAQLNAGSTTLALSTLFSPAFYDSQFSEILRDHKYYLSDERIDLINQVLVQNGIHLVEDIGPNVELVRALALNGYDTTGIAINYGVMAAAPFNQFYDIFNTSTNYALRIPTRLVGWEYILSLSGDLPQLLRQSSLLSIVPEHIINVPENSPQWQEVDWHSDEVQGHISFFAENTEQESQIYRMLLDVQRNTSAPRFTFVTLFFSHLTHWSLFDPYISRHIFEWELGNIHERLYLYILAYEYSATVMLNAIDLILEDNPDAVIVLQADHGLHSAPVQNHLLEIGYSKDDVLEKYLSVFSAVRISPVYGELDEPLDPRNISRLLINSFVGDNYMLIP